MTQQQVDKMIEEMYLVAQKYGVEFETDIQDKCLNLSFELYEQDDGTFSTYEDGPTRQECEDMLKLLEKAGI